MSIKSDYEHNLTMVPEEYFYKWYELGAKRPAAWVKIEVKNNPITGGRSPDPYQADFSEYKDWSPLIAPFYINCLSTSDDHGFRMSSNNNYSYVYTPSTVAFLLMNSANIGTGLQSTVQLQQGQEKPKIVMTFHEVDAPKEGKVNVLSEHVCTDCEIKSFQIRQEVVHLQFHYGNVTYKDTKNGGNILTFIDNTVSAKAGS